MLHEMSDEMRQEIDDLVRELEDVLIPRVNGWAERLADQYPRPEWDYAGDSVDPDWVGTTDEAELDRMVYEVATASLYLQSALAHLEEA